MSFFSFFFLFDSIPSTLKLLVWIMWDLINVALIVSLNTVESIKRVCLVRNKYADKIKRATFPSMVRRIPTRRIQNAHESRALQERNQKTA